MKKIETVNIPEIMKANRERLEAEANRKKEIENEKKQNKKESILIAAILTAIVAITFLTCATQINTDTEKAMNNCMESGQSESWCEYHVYR